MIPRADCLDDLDDVLTVDVGLDLGHRQAQRLELLAPGAGGRLHAIAHLAVDLAHELVGVALQPALIGGRPRLLPHPATGQQLMGVGSGVRPGPTHTRGDRVRTRDQ